MISTILQIIRLLGVLRTESIKLKGRVPRKTLRKAGKAEIERGDFRFRANVNKSPEVRQSRDYSGNIRVQFDQTIENGWRNSSERQFCHVRRNSKGQVSESSTLCPLLHCPLSGSSAKLMSLNGYLKGYSYPKVSILIFFLCVITIRFLQKKIFYVQESFYFWLHLFSIQFCNFSLFLLPF